MSAIAYITDSKMLELHRLLCNQTMNFWRLSPNIHFRDFKVGDLVFFLSKDKEHMRKKEKGIVGFGRLESLRVYSVDTMWKKYDKENGYNSKEEFKFAIRKVSKEHKLPRKISSMHLVDVTFFQVPVYLSECGMEISNCVESYIYLNDPSVVFSILEKSKGRQDLWSSVEDDVRAEQHIEEEQIRHILFRIHEELGEWDLKENEKRKIYKELKEYQIEHPEFSFVQDGQSELYHIFENKVKIIFVKGREMDERILLGQALSYRNLFQEHYPYDLEVTFEVLFDEKLTKWMNSKVF